VRLIHAKVTLTVELEGSTGKRKSVKQDEDSKKVISGLMS
jgi:hypothetical protein